mgnify:FL=1
MPDKKATSHAGTHTIIDFGIPLRVDVRWQENYCQDDEYPDGHTGWVCSWESLDDSTSGDSRGVFETSKEALLAFFGPIW